jgi:hypothetical protein
VAPSVPERGKTDEEVLLEQALERCIDDRYGERRSSPVFLGLRADKKAKDVAQE